MFLVGGGGLGYFLQRNCVLEPRLMDTLQAFLEILVYIFDNHSLLFTILIWDGII